MKLIGISFSSFAIVVIVIAIIPILIPDEDYSAGAQQWFDIANTPVAVPPRQNRFHAEVGFHASPNDNFIEQGINMVNGANEVLRANQSEFDEAWFQPAVGASESLARIDFDAVSLDPLGWLTDNPSLLPQLVEENQVLLERYRKINAMQDYGFTLTADYRAPIPGYAGLSFVHRLNSLLIADSILNNNGRLAQLRQQVEARRRALAQAAPLIEKLINVNLLRFDLRLYAALMREPGLAAGHQPLTGLSDEERTLQRAYIHEFVSASAIFDDGFENASESEFERWMLSLYLKKRKFENHVHQHTWLHLLSQESLPLGERQHQPRESTYGWWDIFSDPIGYVLYEIAMPSFAYHDRLEHLDGLITLVNTAAEVHRRNLDPTAIANFVKTIDAGTHPGYQGASLTYDAAQGLLSFAIPGFSSEVENEPPELSIGPR